MKKTTIVLIIFLLIGAYSIISKNSLDVKNNQEDRVSFAKKFSGWIFDIGKNIKDLTGQATKQEWLPKEQTDNDTIK